MKGHNLRCHRLLPRLILIWTCLAGLAWECRAHKADADLFPHNVGLPEVDLARPTPVVRESSSEQFCHLLGTSASATTGCSGFQHNRSPSEHDPSVIHSRKDISVKQLAEGRDQTSSRIQSSDPGVIDHGAKSELKQGLEVAERGSQERRVSAALAEQGKGKTKEISLESSAKGFRDQVSSMQLAEPGRLDNDVLPTGEWVGEAARTQPRSVPQDHFGDTQPFIGSDEELKSNQRHLLQSTPDTGAPNLGNPLDGWKTEWQNGLLAIALTAMCSALTLGVSGLYFYRRHRDMITYADTDAFYQACAGALGEQGTDPRREKEDLVTSAALITAGELTKANVILERIVQRDPDNCESLHMQAVVAFRHGEMDMAKIAVDRAIKVEPEAHFYNTRGLIQLRLRNKEAATADFEEAIRIKPELVPALVNLGHVKLVEGRLPEAVTYLEKALTREPNYFKALYNLGLAHLAMKKTDIACIELEDAQELCPKEHLSDTSYQAGIAYLRLGRIEEARKSLERAAGPGHHIRGSYRHPYSVCKLAHLFLWEGKVKAAGEKYLAALEIEPECAEATCGLGVVEWAQGRFLEAEELFALALESDLGLAPAVHWMVQSLLDQERDTEAFEVYADAVKWFKRQEDAAVQQKAQPDLLTVARSAVSMSVRSKPDVLRAPVKNGLSGLYAAGMVLSEIGALQENKEVGLIGFGLSLDQWKGYWCEQGEKEESLDDGEPLQGDVMAEALGMLPAGESVPDGALFPGSSGAGSVPGSEPRSAASSGAGADRRPGAGSTGSTEVGKPAQAPRRAGFGSGADERAKRRSSEAEDGPPLVAEAEPDEQLLPGSVRSEEGDQIGAPSPKNKKWTKRRPLENVPSRRAPKPVSLELAEKDEMVAENAGGTLSQIRPPVSEADWRWPEEGPTGAQRVPRHYRRAVLISSRVKNAALLAAATLDDVDAIEFDWATWTLDDITTAMNRRLEGSSIEGVALVSHNTKKGAIGLVRGGHTSLASLIKPDVQQFWVRVSACLDGNRHNFLSFDAGAALNSLASPKQGRIDLLGCGLADAKGEELLDELRTLTFADVSTSLDDLIENPPEVPERCILAEDEPALGYFHPTLLVEWLASPETSDSMLDRLNSKRRSFEGPDMVRRRSSMESISESNPQTARLVGSKPSSPRLPDGQSHEPDHHHGHHPENGHHPGNGHHHVRPDTSPPEVYDFEIPGPSAPLRKAHSDKKRDARASPVPVRTAFPEAPGEASGRGTDEGGQMGSGLSPQKLSGENGNPGIEPGGGTSKLDPGVGKGLPEIISAREGATLKGSPKLSPSVEAETENPSLLFRPRKVPTSKK